MILSYKYRVEPNKAQVVALEAMLHDFCDLYNAALQQRIEAYRRRGISLNYFDQASELRAVRADCDGLDRWAFNAEQEVLRRVEMAFKCFFRRKRGFPRFRPKERFRAASFRLAKGMTVRRSGKLRIVGIPGEIKINWHRSLPSKPGTAILSRQGGKWYIIFRAEAEAPTQITSRAVGIDLGLVNLVALSSGEKTARPNWTRRAAKARRRRQRAIARCKRESNVRRKRVAALGKFSAHVAARRRDFCHKLTRDVVSRFGRIAIENIKIKNLVRKRRGGLAKHIFDAAWGQIIEMLDYKAANAGGQVVKVDPSGTSRTCPGCGNIAAKDLDSRWHSCQCGCSMDRDVAAAIIIHNRAFGFSPGTGHGQLSGPVAAKL